MKNQKIRYKYIKEHVWEWVLRISAATTSIAILFIVIFLFSEGFNLFKSKAIEEGYVLLINKKNELNSIKPSQIKKIFDSEITTWSSLGITVDESDDILLFRLDDIYNYASDEEIGANMENVPTLVNKIIQDNPNIIVYVPEKFFNKNSEIKILDIGKISPFDFFFGKEWFPTSQPAPQFGVLPIIMGTLWVSLFAILFALPFGLAAAIYLSELASNRTRKILKPTIELLAGIPSVVYGFFGLVIIVPLIQKTFNLPVGETGLAGSIILAIMALPTIITVSEDALSSTPRSMKEASLALGANKWQTISKVILPYASSGITAAIVLGIGRAIGETMAVLMVTGNAAIIPHSLFEPLRTIPATIAAELGEAPKGGTHYQALFMLGIILFVITLIINFSVEYISHKRKLNN